MMAARVGAISTRVEAEQSKQLPVARISPRAAEQLVLPCGVRFGQATPEQLRSWFHWLLASAGMRVNCLVGLLADDIDLTDRCDRWYVLQELMERRKVRDVLAGRVPTEQAETLLDIRDVEQLLGRHGLKFYPSTNKTTGKVTFYAGLYVRHCIYIGTQAMLEAGKLSREDVLARLAKHGLVSPPQETKSEQEEEESEVA